MEIGSNKSLFTLIAVVIFGVFLSLSYWLFQDELKSTLASVMDKTSVATGAKLDGYLEKNYFPDPDFSDANTLNYFTSRNVTEELIKEVTINGDTETTLHHYFPNICNNISAENGVAIEFLSSTYTNFNSKDLDSMKIGDKLTVSFYAKSDKELNFKSRPGGRFYDTTNVISKGLTNEWQKVDLVFILNKRNEVDNGSALVYWLDQPGHLWISDLRIKINNNF